MFNTADKEPDTGSEGIITPISDYEDLGKVAGDEDNNEWFSLVFWCCILGALLILIPFIFCGVLLQGRLEKQ